MTPEILAPPVIPTILAPPVTPAIPNTHRVVGGRLDSAHHDVTKQCYGRSLCTDPFNLETSSCNRVLLRSSLGGSGGPGMAWPAGRHPMRDGTCTSWVSQNGARALDTFRGRIPVEWDPVAAVIRHYNGRELELGFVEGLNSKILVLQRRADGLRGEEHLRVKILTFRRQRI